MLNGLPAVRLLTKVLPSMHDKSDKPVKPFVLKYILPLVYPEPFNILQA